MPKIFQFTRVSFRDLFFTAGPPTLLVVACVLTAYWLINPAPPRHIVLATGQENSAYETFGKQYAAALARHGITVTLQPSLGSQDNLQHLTAADDSVDVAFVQSGSVAGGDHAELLSLGSLFVEPVWIFLRDGRRVADFHQLKGLKINVGPEGTGVPRLFRQLLDANNIEAEDIKLSALENTPATVELLAGRVDGVVFSSAPDAPLIQMLLQTPGIQLFDFTQAEAYARRLPYLSHVVLPQGIVDLGKNLPARDYHLIAPTATLVARAELHPALVKLLVRTAAEIHGGAGWFARQGEFPSASYTEITVADAARDYYRNGPSLMQNYLPFWLANFFERMWVVIVAIGALALPLSRILPPLYVWRVRSRVYRWYGKLRAVEQAIEEVTPVNCMAVYREQLQRLGELEDKVNHISIPLSFAEELYRLRSHIHLVRKRIQWRMQSPSEAA